MSRFPKYTFLVAGVYGLIVTVPMFFRERQIGADHPAGITHPEFYYGFAGLCLAWQLVFLLISTDPVRYRRLMPIAIIEKLAFAVPVPILYFQQRVGAEMLAASLIDAVLGVLFVVSFLKTPPDTAPPAPPHLV